MHRAGDLFMRLGAINGHIGRHIDRLDGAYGGYCVCQGKLDKRMLLEFVLGKHYMKQIHELRDKKRRSRHTECQKMRKKWILRYQERRSLFHTKCNEM